MGSSAVEAIPQWLTALLAAANVPSGLGLGIVCHSGTVFFLD